jgi:hypothetical protein
MYNSVYGNAPAHLVNSVVMAGETNNLNTRISNTLKVDVPYCRTNVMKRSFIYRASNVWNEMPSNLHECPSIDNFKKGAKLFFK